MMTSPGISMLSACSSIAATSVPSGEISSAATGSSSLPDFRIVLRSRHQSTPYLVAAGDNLLAVGGEAKANGSRRKSVLGGDIFAVRVSVHTNRRISIGGGQATSVP